LHELFLQLTSPTRVASLQKVLQSPFTLHDSLLEKTKREAAHARAGKPARIIAKMNALIEPQIIQALYQASMAGVKVDLIVRGICALRFGVRGISDNIRVRSIVGRFLEHSRVYYFHNDGQPDLYCASADWMERNFFRRIEVCFPVEDKGHRERILQDLEIYLADNVQAWELQADGTDTRLSPGDGPALNAQQTLLERYAELASARAAMRLSAGIRPIPGDRFRAPDRPRSADDRRASLSETRALTCALWLADRSLAAQWDYGLCAIAPPT